MASRLRVDASEFSALLNDAKEFERDLGLRLRKNIRDAAKPIVKKMGETVNAPTSKRSAKIKGSKVRTRTVKSVDFDGTVIKERERYTVATTTNTAALVAKGISFRVSTGKSGGQGKFVSSGKALPADRKPMFRALNKKSFRHPVFGDTKHWVGQAGRPYFGSVILGETDALFDAIESSLNEAARALGRSRVR